MTHSPIIQNELDLTNVARQMLVDDVILVFFIPSPEVGGHIQPHGARVPVKIRKESSSDSCQNSDSVVRDTFSPPFFLIRLGYLQLIFG